MRLYETTDYQRIALMDSQCFRPDHPVIDWEDCVWFVGIHNGIDVCYCGIKVYDGFAYLNRAGVMPLARGNGYQTRMLRKRLDYVRKFDHIKYICTDTVAYNIASNNNLIRNGFTMYKPEHPWKEAGNDGIYWRKHI